MNQPDRYFSVNYQDARAQFREGVALRGGHFDSLELSAKGPQGEALTIDIGWFGAARPKRVLVHSCGLHGVEALAGSAIQRQWLRDRIPMLPTDAAIVLVHVMNPYGMTWLRRVNENSVDLNRNFFTARDRQDDARWSLSKKIVPFLNPASLPSNDLFYLRAIGLAARYGMPALRQAVACGQYGNPKYMFFGGERMEEGPQKFQDYMRDRLKEVQRVVGIDIHTGLGRYGEDKLLVVGAKERKPINETLRTVFGERVQVLTNDGIAYDARGIHPNMYYRSFPNASVYFVSQEFGTFHPLRIVAALRAENRWHHWGAGTIDHPTKAKLREVFNPGDHKWRASVLERGRAVIYQALGLALVDDPIGTCD